MSWNKINGISPKNWAKMFPGTDGASDFVKKNFIKFTAYSSPGIRYEATSTQGATIPGSPLGSYSFYYPKNTIREEISHDYSPLEGAYADTLRAGKELAVDAVRGGIAIANIGKNTSHGVLTEEPTYFLKSEKRRFDMTIDLYSISTTSANDDVYNPILFFKRYSHARRGGSIGGSWDIPFTERTINARIDTIHFPGTFVLSGGMFESPALSPVNDDKKHLVLRNMSVEYNPEIQFVDESGYPVHARMTLSFEEIQSLMQEDWAGTPLKESISVTGKRS